jgi:hypothetical protein
MNANERRSEIGMRAKEFEGGAGFSFLVGKKVGVTMFAGSAGKCTVLAKASIRDGLHRRLEGAKR